MKISARFFYIWISIVVSFFSMNRIATAQSIQTDGTTPTQPESCAGNCIIKGGLQQGNNLFHSFEKFNVDTGATVLFQDSGVSNILSRVTGKSEPSQILGTLGVQGGNANLFLINPNGIIFGPNSSLDVNGSFLATTADAIRFGEQCFLDTALNDIPLLTVNPSALFFTDGNNGVIRNESVAPVGENLSGSDILGLRVPDGKSLLLVGGEVVLDKGRVNAFGGRVELGGLAEAGEIKLNLTNTEEQNISLSYPVQLQRANVLLTNQAGVRVFSTEGGSIAIYAENISISEKTFVLAGIGKYLGTDDSQAGNITLDATNKLEVINNSIVSNQVPLETQGNGGDININSGSVFIDKESFIQTPISGEGNAGNININVPNGPVIISTESEIKTIINEDGIGIGGNIRIVTKEIFLENNSAIDANTRGQGNAGNINMFVAENMIVSSNSRILSGINSTGTGNAGSIYVKAKNLSLDSGSQLVANVLGRGQGGNVSLNIVDSVNLIGFATEGQGLSSGIVTATEEGAEGRAGDITIRTNSFRIADGAIISSQTVNESRGGDIVIKANTFESVRGGQIITSADNSGNAGNINIEVSENILLSGSDPNFANRLADFEGNIGDFGKAIGNEAPGNSGFFASVRSEASGTGGNIEIATGRLRIQEGAEVNVSATGSGAAGSLEVDASSVLIDDGQLTANTIVGSEGNIFLDANTLLLRNNSEITTNASEEATGGNITITSELTALLNNSDITANAFRGRGGNIQINTQGLFQEPDSVIDAASDLGIDGTITINNPEVDPTSGIVELPSVPIDAAAILAQDLCRLEDDRIAGGSSFIITGRGGLTPTSEDPLVNRDQVVNWANREDLQVSESGRVGVRQRVETDTPARHVIQSQGWVRTADGSVWLTASAPETIPQNSSIVHPDCRAMR